MELYELVENSAEYNDKIKKRVSSYIVENNVSLAELANTLGIDYSNMYQRVYYRQRYDLTFYVALCRALDVPLETFLSDLTV